MRLELLDSPWSVTVQQEADTDICIVNEASLLLELQAAQHYTDHS